VGSNPVPTIPLWPRHWAAACLETMRQVRAHCSALARCRRHVGSRTTASIRNLDLIWTASRANFSPALSRAVRRRRRQQVRAASDRPTRRSCGHRQHNFLTVVSIATELSNGNRSVLSDNFYWAHSMGP